MSRGNFCPATSRCLFWPTGLSGLLERLLVRRRSEIPNHHYWGVGLPLQQKNLHVASFSAKRWRGGFIIFFGKSSKTRFEKSSVDTKVQNVGSKKVRWTPKFKMLVRKKFGGPNCSARVRKQSSKEVRSKKSSKCWFEKVRGAKLLCQSSKQSSKKVRWKKSSKCWFEKSSGSQNVLPEFENIVRKKFGGKKSSKCWFEKSSGGQTVWATWFEKSSTAKRCYKP